MMTNRPLIWTAETKAVAKWCFAALHSTPETQVAALEWLWNRSTQAEIDWLEQHVAYEMTESEATK